MSAGVLQVDTGGLADERQPAQMPAAKDLLCDLLLVATGELAEQRAHLDDDLLHFRPGGPPRLLSHLSASQFLVWSIGIRGAELVDRR